MKINYLDHLFSLKGKTAIVTGASGYFGERFSEALLSAGAKVVMFGRSEKINFIAKKLKIKYGTNRVDHYRVDFYDDYQYQNCLKEVISENKRIDILINNAYEFSKHTGFNDSSGKLENISKEQWMKSLESGVYWHALAIQKVCKKMKEQKSGSIINVSSMYALISPDPKLYEGVDIFNPPSYGVAKAGLLALTRYSAAFLGGYGIRCNAIVPGSFPNDDPKAYNSPKNNKFIKKLRAKTILGRTGNVQDLLGCIVFLASDSSSYITGQSIVIDGGWTTT